MTKDTHQDDRLPLSRIAKGPRPTYLDERSVDTLHAMVFSLAQELSVTRERLDSVERVLSETGTLDRAAVDDFRPNDDASEERAAQCDALLERLFRPLTADLKSSGLDVDDSAKPLSIS